MPTYSHSRLGTFEQCPLKFKFQYIDKIEKPKEKGVEAFVGSLVHTTLQKLYDDLILERVNSLDNLIEHFRGLWAQEWGPDIKIVRKDMTQENYIDYGVKCIRNYYERYHPFNQSQTIQTEANLTFPLDGEGGHQITGFIDRLARRPDGTWEIHDYKTSRSLPPQETLDNDRQLALYQIGLPSRWKEIKDVELIWHYVALDTTLRSSRSPSQLDDLRKETINLIDQIESTTEFPTRKSKLCDWCEFKTYCPLFKHGEEVAVLSEKQFSEDDGVRLVTGFAQTQEEKKAIDTQLKDLRSQLVEFARQKDVSVIFGKGVQVHVTIKPKTRLPGKSDDGRTELVQTVKDSGHWEEVADLDTTALVKIIDEGIWPQPLLNKLEMFVSREETVTVRVSRSKELKDDEA